MTLAKSILSGFAHIFYPRVCGVCNTDLIHAEKVICLSCLYKMPLTRFWNDADNPIAQTFWGRVEIENACAYFFFAKGSKYRPLLHQLKYKGKYEIGVELGLIFGQTLAKSDLYKGIDYTIPVPLHPKKLRIRGYNQAEAIAEGIAKGLDIGMDTSHLVRKEFTETQTRKSRTERIKNVADAFELKNGSELKGKHLLLVDDVITTGATIEACAAKLLTVEGCKVSVGALAYANT
ncbi:MAG: phosphoribosyltransferase family protein [Bacteroidales bacterium]|nr:phosphoribosyltransferase family protein [Bacteroidales bacterium]MDD3891632.1 phosphoribosyltransferase family protein [Bacteroidales bacterium]